MVLNLKLTVYLVKLHSGLHSLHMVSKSVVVVKLSRQLLTSKFLGLQKACSEKEVNMSPSKDSYV